jgi:hypothetical protein
MNLIELNRALRQLRLGGIATVLEMRLHQAQVETMANRSLVSIWPPLLSSPAVKTRFFLVHLAAARVISRKPSGWLPSYKAIGCSTARLTPYSRNWPMPPSTYAQRTRRVVGCRAPTYHRRSWHAEAYHSQRPRSAGDHHVPLRARQHHDYLKPTGGRLGETPGRQCSGDRYARSSAASWPRTKTRSTQLAHKNRLATSGGGRVKQPSLGLLQSMAGFALILYGRFSGDH